MAVKRGSLGDMFVDTQEEYDREVKRISDWIRDAIRDGWDFEATYEGHEDAARAMTLKRDGWVVQTIRRPPGFDPQWKRPVKGNINISCWGKDGTAVVVQFPYDWTSMQGNSEACQFCDARGVEMHRVGFANRACAACLPAARKEIEFPGWCN